MSAGVDGQVVSGTGRLAAWSNFVKIAHTVFALPFAVVGIVAAARLYPVSWLQVVVTVGAFASARFAAMGFNRIVDLEYDTRNPRTASRELPTGRMSVREAWILVFIAAVLFVVLSAMLNRLCLWLSPIALVWVCGYSFTKRFTHFSHLWLGWGLAIAPVGGYLAITGRWSTPAWLLLAIAGAVACWSSGFDVLYSLQDEQFDRSQGLRSLPVLLGARFAIMVARLLHFLAILLLVAFWRGAGFGWIFGVSVAVAAALLAWEHRLVRVGDYSKLDVAFFTMNGIISGVVALGAIADLLVHA